MPTFDFVIVGGGTAGLVLASRLSYALPDVSILLLEAGPGGDDPRIAKSGGYHVGMDPDLEWDHYTVPQKGINGKVVPQVQGKLLGGASAINQQGWTRGPSVDLNQWAEMVGDERWSWAGMLPYFKKSETFYPTDEMNSLDVSKNHGFDGPIKVSHAIGSGLPRKYPLRDMTAKAYESVGVHRNQDLNSGDVLGYAEGASSNFEGKRQYATAYPLRNNVTTWTRSLATKLIFENGKVTGVEIQKSSAVGEPEPLSIFAKREVILTSGVQGSPKLLLLSGIGPAEELRKHSISQVCDLPVGENYSDHPFFYTMWKLRDRGLCLGDGPLVTPDCDWTAGFPGDWMAFHRHDDIIEKFGSKAVDESKLKLLLAEGKPHAESFSVYGHIDLSRTGTPHPGGSAMVLGTLVVKPTSRGNLKLRSANPLDAPLLDPNLLSNELDRQMLYSTGRLMLASMHGPIGQQWGVEEYGIEESIRHDTSDAAMEARMMKTFRTLNHGGGTCAMGSVVDSSCRVIGVEGLRVVDASIFPMPMGCHYQAIVYAIAEQMADLVIAEQK